MRLENHLPEAWLEFIVYIISYVLTMGQPDFIVTMNIDWPLVEADAVRKSF